MHLADARHEHRVSTGEDSPVSVLTLHPFHEQLIHQAFQGGGSVSTLPPASLGGAAMLKHSSAPTPMGVSPSAWAAPAALPTGANSSLLYNTFTPGGAAFCPIIPMAPAEVGLPAMRAPCSFVDAKRAPAGDFADANCHQGRQASRRSRHRKRNPTPMQLEQMHRTHLAKQQQQEMMLEAQRAATMRGSGALPEETDPLKRWLRAEYESGNYPIVF